MLGYKLKQHATALNSVGVYNTVIFMYLNIEKIQKNGIKYFENSTPVSDT